MPASHIIRFNPTATATQHDGSDESKKQIVSLLTEHDLADNPESVVESIKPGMWVVIFMGGMMVLNDHGFRSAQGLV